MGHINFTYRYDRPIWRKHGAPEVTSGITLEFAWQPGCFSKRIVSGSAIAAGFVGEMAVGAQKPANTGFARETHHDALGFARETE